MVRRTFVGAASALLAVGPTLGQATRPRPTFRVLYSNDTTNLQSCGSPYHRRGESFSLDHLRASIDEAAGCDVHLLQPGLGWIPWWRSRLYPPAEHYRWVEESTGVKPDSFGRFLCDGGDLVQTFLDHCRLRGQIPFISYRLNDGHHLENVGTRNRQAIWVSRFYAEHPEYRLGANPQSWDERVHNWALPEVRAHKLALLTELCEEYDLPGLELDFMRHNSFFRLAETPVAERVAIMTEFVGQVRAVLDRTARGGRRRWLCARVPCLPAERDKLGVSLPELHQAGLDLANLSAYYYTQQYHDLAACRAQAPELPLYLEMTHTTTIGPSRGGYDTFSFRRTTDPQFTTTAHLAYQRGAAGVSLFNFVYYREHGGPERGPFCEPPFHLLPKLADPAWLAGQPQWFFLARSWRTPLIDRLKDGQARTFTLDLALRDGPEDALVRIVTQEDGRSNRWEVQVNGQTLAPTALVARPLGDPYEGGQGGPELYACFACPRGLLRPGANEVTLLLTGAPFANVVGLDLIVP